jgi:hypothetical protein
MTDNPYAAPKAPVSDINLDEAPLRRPAQVVWAIQLLVAGWAFGLIVGIMNWGYYRALGSIGSMTFGQLVGAFIGGWIYYKIWQGRNWARIVYLVFILIGFVGLVVVRATGITASAPASIRAGSLVGMILAAAVVWLLFFSPGRVWFRPRH